MKIQKKNPVIALAPIRYFDISKRDNVVKILEYIKEAGRKQADIICFPESCLYKTAAFDINSNAIQEIRRECEKNHIWCIITEDLIINKKRYNTAILIDRKGDIKGRYKKIHPYTGEEVRAGKDIKVFRTDFAKIGIAICWDLGFPDLFKKMKEKGAQIVFCPSQWRYEYKVYDKKHKEKEIELLQSLVKTRAFENIFFIALINPLTDKEDQVSYSAIVSPHKTLKETLDSEELMIAELNLNEIKKVENVYKKD